MSNQPQPCHSGSSLSDRTLNQPADHSRHQPSHLGERSANHLSEAIQVSTNFQTGSLSGPASEQISAKPASRRGSRLRLVQSSDEQPQVSPVKDPLLTAQEVAERLNVTKDWVWDHSTRKAPHLPVIRMGDGTLRYRASRIEEFIDERERLTTLRRKRG